MALPKLRKAVDSDWHAIMAMPEPAEWAGIVLANEHLILGFGFLYGATDGRWWICFQRVPGVRMVKTAHRCAGVLLAAATEAGVAVYALADLRITGATKWLSRLGFEPTDEDMKGAPVWVRR